MQATKSGYVYIFGNKMYKDSLKKIGYTQKTLEHRIQQLYSGNTSVPQNFDLEYACHVQDCVDAEKKIHKILQSYRHNNKREFFLIRTEIAKNMIHKICEQINATYGIIDFHVIDNNIDKENLFAEISSHYVNDNLVYVTSS